MADQDTNRKKVIRRFDMRTLKWMAIVLPILFLATVDVLRHTVFSQELHTLSGFLFTYAILTAGVVAFSFTIFGIIARLQARVTEKNEQLSALNAIALASTQNLPLEKILETGQDQVLKVLKADAGLVCIVDMEQEEHSAACHRGFSPEVARRIQRAKLKDDPIAQEVVRTGRPVVMENVFEDPRVAEAAKREGIKSAISAPLKAEGEVTGILVVATRSERHFTAADHEFLAAIGGQLGLAIRSAVLFDRSQRRNRELATLVEVGKAVAFSLDISEVLSRSLNATTKVAAADAAEIWLLDDKDLVMKCHAGSHREAFFEKPRLAIGEGLVGLAAQSQALLCVHDLPSDPRFARHKVVESGFRTFCALPLRYRDRLVGVLAVAALSTDVLRKPGDFRLLEAIGERITVAIVNAELHQQVQDLAVLQERERIAREMHDGMAQLLGYINTQTLAVKRFLSCNQLAEAHEEIAKMQEIARDLYADVREGILGLRTSAHREGGLLPAFKEYAERYTEMSGVSVSIMVAADAQSFQLAPSVEVQLMRMLQEALTNVRKHARATSVDVTFERTEDRLQVTVADNGRGFDLAHLPSTGWPHFGLQTMRERAEAVNGTLTIDSEPGQGTRVVARVPVVPQRDYSVTR